MSDAAFLGGWEVENEARISGPVMDYPEGRRLPSAKSASEIRVLPKATSDTIRYAERLWPQRDAEKFEQRGKLWVERKSGDEYRRVRGNPMLGDDKAQADLFIVVDDSIIFLTRAASEPTTASEYVGTMGAWRT